MKKVIAALAAFFCLTAEVGAALTRLPIRDYEDMLEHLLLNTDVLGIDVGDGGLFIWTYQNLLTYTKDDGTEESINALVRRSRSEFELLISRKWREAVRWFVSGREEAMIGKTIEVAFELSKNVRESPKPSSWRDWVYLKGDRKEAVIGEDADGNPSIPEELFTVDLSSGRQYMSTAVLMVPDILSATVTTDYPEWGDPWSESLTVSSEEDIDVPEDILYVPIVFVTDPLYKTNSTIKITFRGGIEQVFSLADGSLLNTYVPVRAPLSLTVSTDGTVELSVAEDGAVAIDYSPTLPPRWEELQYATTVSSSSGTLVRKSSVGNTFFHSPTNTASGFYQARRVRE